MQDDQIGLRHGTIWQWGIEGSFGSADGHMDQIALVAEGIAKRPQIRMGPTGQDQDALPRLQHLQVQALAVVARGPFAGPGFDDDVHRLQSGAREA